MTAPARSAPVVVPPDDEFNQALVANVHPPGWENPEPAGRYNMVVIGAGTAGLVTAAVAAGLGARVALVERYLMGGDCLTVGCRAVKGNHPRRPGVGRHRARRGVRSRIPDLHAARLRRGHDTHAPPTGPSQPGRLRNSLHQPGR